MKNLVFEYLDIDCRVVVSDKNEYCTENNTIYLKPFSDMVNSAYNFAHECYHAYQWKHKRYLFKNYKERQQCKSLEEYNLQRIEYEAHAFACRFIDVEFEHNIKLDLSEYLPEKVIKKIEIRKRRGF